MNPMYVICCKDLPVKLDCDMTHYLQLKPFEGESQRDETMQYIPSAVDSTCKQQCTKDTRMFLTKL